MLMRSGLESGTVAYRRTDAATQRQRRAARHFRRSSRACSFLPERTPRDHSRGPRAPSGAPRARRRQVCARSRLRRRRGQPDPAGRALRSRDAPALPHRRRATPAGARRVPPTLMEFHDVARKRKMIRSFEDRPIPREADGGLGALFFGVFDQATLRETFGIPDEYTAMGVIAVSYAKTKDRPSPSLKLGHRAPADVVRRGRWSS